MLSILFLLAARPQLSIDRDAFGVPHIHGTSIQDAFTQAGYAVAQDRLWQMELSRRLARGKLAEVFGKAYLASDKEVITTGYSDEELKQQFDALSPKSKAVVQAYARGVNAWLAQVVPNNLPEGYKKAGFQPEEWTTLDTVAICIHLLQVFGRGGAGELRNLALLSYLQGQKPIGKQILNVVDDIAWPNEPEARTTLSATDDALSKTHFAFYQPDRKATEAHLAKIPKLSLIQLMSGIRVSEREESTHVAENLSAPFESGSYCVVVSPSKSGTGHPLLLSGPQMGTQIPSIAHEMSIEAPGLSTVGMDVPGVPGVIIGHTKTFAWGITSGVADTDDIYFFPSNGNSYPSAGMQVGIQKSKVIIHVKGGEDVTVERARTIDGPIVMTAANTIFTKKSSYWMREMRTYDAWTDLWSAPTPSGIETAMDAATMNFNFFYATVAGDYGWRYLGLVPKRAPGVDPRFPTPGGDQYEWRGFLSPQEMPHVRNPKSGFLANWNSKPVAWWPNFDTPVWGKIFRDSALIANLQKPQLMPQDLEMSAWTIARTDENWPYFKPYIELAKGAPGYDLIKGFDGRTFDGSRQASNFKAFMLALRQELFLKTTGNFISPDFFNTVLQPSLMLRALEGKTKFSYLGVRTAAQVVKAALARVAAHPSEPFKAPTFRSLDPTAVPYSDRGTYIQIIEFLKNGIYGRNLLPPGVAETGPHSNDQTPLARAWMYKAMGWK